jgi:hypothetical protein
MRPEPQHNRIADIHLRIWMDNILKVWLQADATIDMDVVVRFKNFLVPLDSGGAIAVGQIESVFHLLHIAQPGAGRFMNEQQGDRIRGARLPESPIEYTGEILLGINRIVRVVMDEPEQGDDAAGLARAVAEQRLICKRPNLRIAAPAARGETWHAGGGKRIAEILVVGGSIVPRADLVVAGSPVRPEYRVPGKFDRQIGTAILRAIEFKAAPVN